MPYQSKRTLTDKQKAYLSMMDFTCAYATPTEDKTRLENALVSSVSTRDYQLGNAYNLMNQMIADRYGVQPGWLSENKLENLSVFADLLLRLHKYNPQRLKIELSDQGKLQDLAIEYNSYKKAMDRLPLQQTHAKAQTAHQDFNATGLRWFIGLFTAHGVLAAAAWFAVTTSAIVTTLTGTLGLAVAVGGVAMAALFTVGYVVLAAQKIHHWNEERKASNALEAMPSSSYDFSKPTPEGETPLQTKIEARLSIPKTIEKQPALATSNPTLTNAAKEHFRLNQLTDYFVTLSDNNKGEIHSSLSTLLKRNDMNDYTQNNLDSFLKRCTDFYGDTTLFDNQEGKTFFENNRKFTQTLVTQLRVNLLTSAFQNTPQEQQTAVVNVLNKCVKEKILEEQGEKVLSDFIQQQAPLLNSADGQHHILFEKDEQLADRLVTTLSTYYPTLFASEGTSPLAGSTAHTGNSFFTAPDDKQEGPPPAGANQPAQDSTAGLPEELPLPEDGTDDGLGTGINRLN